MSNSSLVNYTRLSPNCYKPRQYKIEKITIHHVAGVTSVEALGNIFAPASRKASSNYGIGSDGRIALFVDEANGSWCSNSYDNDNRAITIEVSNSESGGNWPVSDHVLARLIDLCVDICQRNDIERLNFTGDASGNLTQHNYFAPTACPGPYLKSKFQYIADEVNKRLGVSAVTGMPSTGSDADTKKIWDYLMNKIGNPYGVAGLMGNLLAESGMRSDNMQDVYQNKLGYNDKTYTAAVDNGSYTNFVKDSVGYGLAQWTFYTRKQALLDYAKSKNKSIGDLTMQLEFLCKELNGGFSNVLNDLKNATSVLDASNSVLFKFEAPADQGESMQKLRAGYGQGYYDKYADKTPADIEPKFNVGDEIKLASGATYTTGKVIPSWVFNMTLYVRNIYSNGDIVFSTQKSGAVTGTVNPKYVSKVTYEEVKPVVPEVPAAAKFNIGDEVKLIAGAKYTSGKNIASFVFNMKLYVRAISGDNITISIFKSGAITGIVDAKYLVDYNTGKPVTSTPDTQSDALKLGDTVKLVKGATYYDGKSMPAWLFNMTLYVRGINGDNITISRLKSGAITGVVNKKYLTKC